MNTYLRHWRYAVLAVAIVFAGAVVGMWLLLAGGDSSAQLAAPSVISLPNAGRPEVGHAAPEFVLPTTTNGRPLSLASLKGAWSS
jgi:hypothetical protein